MAEIATVVIDVDLHCCTCSKKIKKALCKLQNRFDIQSIVYDEKNNTVTVSGPFNPECFIRKLRCLACEVIIDVRNIPRPPPPPPPPPPPEVVVKLLVCVFVCCKQPCPCYEPRHGCLRCCSCGWVCDGPPPSAACRPCNQVDGCKIVIEEEPCQSWSIM